MAPICRRPRQMKRSTNALSCSSPHAVDAVAGPLAMLDAPLPSAAFGPGVCVALGLSTAVGSEAEAAAGNVVSGTEPDAGARGEVTFRQVVEGKEWEMDQPFVHPAGMLSLLTLVVACQEKPAPAMIAG